MNTLFAYRIHGLTVRSAMELPELAAAPTGKAFDITIEAGAVPVALTAAEARGPLWQFGDGCFLLKIPGVARYLAVAGQHVMVEIEAGAAAGDVRLYLLGSVLGVLLHQRGLLALHASAIEVSGRVVAFSGVSGAGKSTLAAHLRQRGYRVLGDDLLSVDIDHHNQPRAYPSFARIKLWADALNHIDHVPEALMRDQSRLEKFQLRLDGEHFDSPLPLRSVFLLEDNNAGNDIQITPLHGLDAVSGLARATYRPRFLKAMGLQATHFGHCSRVAGRVAVFRLLRPKRIERMSEVVDALEAIWNCSD